MNTEPNTPNSCARHDACPFDGACRRLAPVITAILSLLVCKASAEDVTVFSCTSELFVISKYAVQPSPEIDEESSQEVDLYTFKIGKELRTLETGAKSMEKIVEAALAEDRSQDPFFGPGTMYIIRDSKGHHYVAYFEYKHGHKFYDGRRVGLGKLTDLGSNAAVFVGYPHDGSCFDKAILKQLKEIADSTQAQ